MAKTTKLDEPSCVGVDALVRRLADGLASDIFHTGSERYGKISRLALKGGTWPDQETDLGGLCEQALACVIADSLRKRLGTYDRHECMRVELKVSKVPVEDSCVVVLQKALNRWKDVLLVDGIFGEETDLHTRHFQSYHNLFVDGIVGPVTWAKLELYL